MMSQDLIDEKINLISAEVNKRNEEASILLEYLNKQRQIARLDEELEEEELKKKGIIIGQHIPSLQSKLTLDPGVISEFSEFSNSLLIAKDLIDQNQDTFLRRTGNLPITQFIETKQSNSSYVKDDTVPDVPNYLEKTNNTKAREQRVHARFAEKLETREIERSKKLLSSSSLNLTEKPKQKKIILSAESRIENENIIKSMNHKLNFLRNPRNDPSAVTKMLVKSKASFANPAPQTVIGRSSNESLDLSNDNNSQSYHSLNSETNDSKLEASSKSLSDAKKKYGKPPKILDNPLFKCEPKSALFTNYDVGKNYSQTLSFRNISAVTRSVRILQPSNPVFSLSPLRYPTNCNGGMVAPGMYVSTTVSFTPDSLGDYHDIIRVETESGSYNVPVVAQREPPQLSIPSELNIGGCLVGDVSRVTFSCGNTGGGGAFLIISPEELQEGVMRSTEEISKAVCLRMDSFTIYPIEFTLYRHQSIDLTIEFIPLQLGDFEQEFFIKCDNGQVRRFIIQGSSRSINLYNTEINGAEFNCRDPSVFSDLFFETTNIGNEQTQNIAIVNDTGLPIEYEWVLLDVGVKDLHKAGQNKILDRVEETLRLTGFGGGSSDGLPIGSKNEISMAKSLLVDSSGGSHSSYNKVADREFELFPARGVLAVDGSEKFTVSFNPKNLTTTSIRAVLMAKHVPVQCLPGNDQPKLLEDLATNGHGRYYRLKSWLEEIGTKASVEEYVKPNGDPSKEKSLISLKMILQLVLSQTVGSGGVIPVFEYGRMNQWIRKCQEHLFEFRRNSAVAESESDNEETDFFDEEVIKITVELFDWLDAENNPPHLIYPIEFTSPGKVVDIGHPEEFLRSAIDALRELHVDDRDLMRETWFDIQNAMLILGDSICHYLNDKVKHEAVDYLKDCALNNLAAFNLLVYGEGKVHEVAVTPPVVEIGEHLSVGKNWVGKFSLRNLGDAIVDLDIDKTEMVVRTFLPNDSDFMHSEDLRYHEIKGINDIFSVTFDHDRVLLMPHAEVVVDFTCSIAKIGRYEMCIPFRPTNDSVRIDCLRISANITGSTLRFNDSEIDLGLVGVGGEGKKVISFTNESDVPIMFVMKPSLAVDIAAAPKKEKVLTSRQNTHRESGNLSSRSRASSAHSGDFSVQDSTASSMGDFKIELKYAVVNINPPSGVINPMETLSVSIDCNAGKQPQRIRGMMECRLYDYDGKVEIGSHYLNLRGEVQSPKTIMYPLLINLGQVYVGQPVKFSVTTENLCNLATKYKLLRPGGESPMYQLTFDKPKGSLEAKEKVVVECTFTPTTTGFIDDVISNKIFGTLTPLGFEIKAYSKGVLLEFVNLSAEEIPPAPIGKPSDTQYMGSEKLLEAKAIQPIVVGTDVPLYERKTKIFAIRNLSAIPAHFDLKPKKFIVAEKKKKLGERFHTSLDNSIASLHVVDRTDGIIVPHEKGSDRFQSLAGKQYITESEQRQEDRKFLYSELGASYLIETPSGVIPPWGVQVVRIIAFNDIPGNYDDSILCTLHEGEVESRVFDLPIKMEVTGCPIIIEKDTVGMTVIKKGSATDRIGLQMVQMGYTSVNSPPLIREFYLRNNGSKKGKVKWRLRSIPPKSFGPLKYGLSVSTSGKVQSNIQFWDDLSKDCPFKIEPDMATIDPYGRKKFTVTLFRTDIAGKELAMLTGAISFAVEPDILKSPTNEGHYMKSSSESITSSLTELPTNGIPSQSSNKFTIKVALEGDFAYPTLSIDKNTYVSKDMGMNEAPDSQALLLKAQAPSLFGNSSLKVCMKSFTVINPLEAFLVFSASVEGCRQLIKLSILQLKLIICLGDKCVAR